MLCPVELGNIILQYKVYIFQMQPIIVITIIAIQLLTMPSQSSTFLVSPLDPRVLSKVYNNSRLSNQQKEKIRIFIERVKLGVKKDKNRQLTNII